MTTPAKLLLKRLLKTYIAPYKRRIALAALCMAAAGAAQAANAWLMQPILDDVFIKQDRSMLTVVPLAVLGVSLVTALANFGQTVIMRRVGQGIVADMQIELFSHLMKSDLGFFHDQASGRLVSRFTNDIQSMRNALSSTLTTLAREMLSMVFLLGVMMYQSVPLSIVAFLAFPLAIYPIMRLGKRMRKIAGQTQANLGDFTVRLDEIFQGVRTVKAYAAEELEVAQASAHIRHLSKLYMKAARIQAAAAPMMEIVSGISIASVIAYGGHQVISGATTPGAFFSFMTAFIMAYRPMKAMAGLNTVLQEGLAAASRLFDVLDKTPEVRNAPGALSLTVTSGNIRFEHASFRYAEGAGIDDVTLEIPAGKKIALVGHSGAGKSTLVNLLLRFYNLDAGRITIDGTDINDVTLSSLRRSMALVPQDIVLFDASVRANIAYGMPDATDAAIRRAARDAAAEEFIMNLPEGYDTLIGPNGVRLSGGQRQRLAIARAMLKDAPILLLDEATSALDNTSERLVQDALFNLMKGRTALIIAHRLSTIMHADRIYVMDKGRVAESGTHAELLAAGGLYHTLYAQGFHS